MMKKTLLLATALLMVTSAGAQLKSSSPVRMPMAQMKEMKMAPPGTPAQPRLNANRDARPYYIRPAGAFVGACSYEISDPTYYSMPTNPYLACKPYTDYTYKSVGDGVSANATYTWLDSSADTLTYGHGRDFTVRYEPTTEAYKYYVPILSVGDAWTTYGYFIGNTVNNTQEKDLANVLSALNFGCLEEFENNELLVSSKTFCLGGRWGDQEYIFASYYGTEPYGDNDFGWWFGKNSGTVNGIAQAFEKPTAPYLLRNVTLVVAGMKVVGAVQMTCKVYKLNGIPAYDENTYATLDGRIGEQIATGIANLDASSTDNELITFTLYDVNGMQTITPEIDDAILIVIEGYNSAWMSNLTDFRAFISTDYTVDEGYGELAYVKAGITDNDGNLTGQYEWRGLNNFFHDSEGGLVTMKTGLSIFMVIDQPYIGFYNSLNPGEYTFPASGGLMQQQYDEGPLEKSIRLVSSSPYSNSVWSRACADGSPVPNWLNIAIGNAGDYINVLVRAEALPAGTTYREATVRFSILGAYIDYTFKQGEKSTLRGDVNGDGYVTIDDVTKLINYLLTDNADGMYLENANANLDGVINIADVTTLISYLLTDSWPNK